MTDTPWFADGLAFSCTRCGHCCTGQPGFTWVSEEEASGLAARLGLDAAAFRRRYLRQVHEDGVIRWSLVEVRRRHGDHACVFHTDGVGCTVYEDRPRQCRTWPFWGRVLASPTAWAESAEGCPGMNQGDHHPLDAILDIAADDGLQ